MGYSYFRINPHQFQNSPSLPHSSQQPVNIQKSYNKHTALLVFLLMSCLLVLRADQKHIQQQHAFITVYLSVLS